MRRHASRLFKSPSAIIAAFLFVLLASGAAASLAAKPAPPAALGGDRTQVLVDQQNDIVHISIDGHDIVTIDKAGLHVKGDVTYTGNATQAQPQSGAAP